MALDPIAFQQTHLYAIRAPVEEVLADLKTLEGMDVEAEEKRGLLWVGAWGALLSSIALYCLVGVLWMENQSPELRARFSFLPALVFWVPLLASVVLFIVRARSRKADLENRRYGLVARLLQRFMVDLEPNAPVDLKLDLAPIDESHKCVGRPSRGRWDCEDFTDAWLSLQGRFADGTHLHLSMVDHLQKRKRTRRSASGRTKIKRKTKGKSLLQVALRVKPERHPGLAELGSSAQRAARLPPGIRLSRLEVSEDRVAMRALLPQDWVEWAPKPPAAPAGKKGHRAPPPGPQDASRAATMMLLSLYQVLNFSSSLRKFGSVRASP
ncbi:MULTISPECIES: hypothetical protein [Corallococcus]|uniref:hypothetical protein n=1 Tax=Corallococcus TaxID=83461 RepID=UPI00117BDF57|nr:MULTISPECIES: hypothetical protein [Corallococcus]NBD10181.1 hypothetical protein [Corallococcus silvisoli]TSC27415.1 hypothetical protein FOF48_18405 [Corallococcus sp. Z5C101001]